MAVGLIGAAAIILMARTDMPAADYARAACGDLSRLMEQEPVGEHQVSEVLAKAAARADRAATVDGAFTSLEENLDRVREGVEQSDSLSGAEAARANAAIVALARDCTDLGAAVQILSGLSVDDLRQQ